MILAALLSSLALAQNGRATAQPSRTPEAALESYLAHLAAADASRRLDDLAGFRKWLERAPESYRGFEWRFLDTLRDQSSSRVSQDCRTVAALDVSPDGQRLAIAGGDGSVLVRDLASGRELWRAKLHQDGVSDVKFDARGERLVSSSRDRTVKVWNARDGALLVDFKEHGFPVWAAAFSPDGEFVASCSYERPPGTVVGNVRVWRAQSGEFVRALEGGRKPLSAIEFSPDGKTLACASWDFCLFLWDFAAGGEPRKLSVPDEDIYNATDAVDFSSDGVFVAAAAKDDTARIWRVADGALVASLRGHGNYVTDVRFAPDARTLATASSDETVRLWDVASGKELECLRGHTEGVRTLDFTPDGARLLSGSSDGTLAEWDARSRWFGFLNLELPISVYSSIFSRDGSRLATCTFDGRVQLWNPTTWELIATWQAHPKEKSCHMLAFSPDGTRIYSGSYDKTVAMWDSVTLAELGRLEHEGGLYQLRLSNDGRTLAVSQTDGRVVVWSVEARERRFELEPKSPGGSDLAISPDDRLLGVAGSDAFARIFQLADGELLGELDHTPSTANALVFAHDRSELYSADASGNVLVWRTTDWTREAKIACFNNGVSRLAVSPDGRRLAVTSRDLALVDLQHREHLLSLRLHSDAPWFVDWSPDGHQIATAGQDDTLGVTDDRTLSQRLELRRIGLERAERARVELARRIGAGAAPESLCADLRQDPALAPPERAALLEALTRHIAASRP